MAKFKLFGKTDSAADLDAQIREEGDALSDARSQEQQAWARYNDLLTEGTPDQLRAVEAEAESFALRAKQAEARLPILTACRNELREADAKRRLNRLVTEFEETVPGYLGTHANFLRAAQAVLTAREAISAEFPAVAASIPPLCPFAFDLSGIGGAAPVLRTPPQLFEFETAARRTVRSIKGTLQ